MSIKEHLDKDNLHHAYLIESGKDEALPIIFDFIKSLKIKIENNPDLVQIYTDSFKIEDARNLKIYGNQKGYSSSKKIFIIFANNFLLEAQNSLLKLFEEPIENTYFFVITPDTSNILKTLLSRFYFISAKPDVTLEVKDALGRSPMGEAEKFIKMPLKNRLDFIKEMLSEKDTEDEEEVVVLDSNRAKILRFLNSLEYSLHKNIKKGAIDVKVFEHIFKTREILRMPGSSPKTLIESVALVIPILN